MILQVCENKSVEFPDCINFADSVGSMESHRFPRSMEVAESTSSLEVHQVLAELGTA